MLNSLFLVNYYQRWVFVLIIPLILLFSPVRGIQNNTSHVIGGDTIITLDNNQVTVRYSLFGGALVDFQLKKVPCNPFTWKLGKEDMPVNNRRGAVFQGHFLCMGRWGSPTLGEIAIGIPHNGEPANGWWKQELLSDTFLVMSFEATKELFSVKREVRLLGNSSVFKVTETFFNKVPFSRNLPVVQHATLGTPFIDTSLVIFSNASYGFNQKFIPAEKETYVSHWPYIVADSFGHKLDVRKSGDKDGYVGTFVIEDTIGWVAAFQPKNNILIGYLWNTKDYPWLHIWHGIKNNVLWAKGMEFGTTGLGDTAPVNQRFSFNLHGVGNNNYIDAEASVKKSYYCFQVQLADGCKELKNIRLEKNKITLSVLTSMGLKTYSLVKD